MLSIIVAPSAFSLPSHPTSGSVTSVDGNFEVDSILSSGMISMICLNPSLSLSLTTVV